MNALLQKRQVRGQTPQKEDLNFAHNDNDRLIACLTDSPPVTRTSAADFLRQRQCRDAVEPLCQAVRIEKKLYSRLANSSA